jgi:hypothetical protein
LLTLWDLLLPKIKILLSIPKIPILCPFQNISTHFRLACSISNKHL